MVERSLIVSELSHGFHALIDEVVKNLRDVRDRPRNDPELVAAALGYGTYTVISPELGLFIMGVSGGYYVGNRIFQGSRESRGLDRNIDSH